MADEAILNGNNTNTEESLESLIGLDDSKEDKVAKLEEANKKLYARAKAAEEKAKGTKENPQPLQTNTPNNSLSREEAILLSQGVDTTSLEMLSKISKLEGISLLEAKENDLYKAYLAKIEQEKRAEQSKLGASRGSGRIESTSTAKMSREEHMAMFKEKMGQ